MRHTSGSAETEVELPVCSIAGGGSREVTNKLMAHGPSSHLSDTQTCLGELGFFFFAMKLKQKSGSFGLSPFPIKFGEFCLFFGE